MIYTTLVAGTTSKRTHGTSKKVQVQVQVQDTFKTKFGSIWAVLDYFWQHTGQKREQSIFRICTGIARVQSFASVIWKHGPIYPSHCGSPRTSKMHDFPTRSSLARFNPVSGCCRGPTCIYMFSMQGIRVQRWVGVGKGPSPNAWARGSIPDSLVHSQGPTYGQKVMDRVLDVAQLVKPRPKNGVFLTFLLLIWCNIPKYEQ